MGWAAGTDVMDAVMEAVYSYTAALAAEAFHVDIDTVPDETVNELMRPVVRTVAEKLNDRGWDTQEESDFFEEFMQEMLDHDDAEHLIWLRERRRFADDPAELARWDRHLDAFRRRMRSRRG